MTQQIDDRWIRRFHPGAPGALPLVFFPHAGGGASSALQLSKALTPSVEVLSLQYPGRQDRRTEGQIAGIHELADELAGVLADGLAPEAGTPYAFFGHSMGAILAFEVARRLEEAIGNGPGRLIVSARRAPSVPRHELHHLRDDAGLLSVIRGLSGTDQRVFEDEELLALALPTIRGDYRAIETYVYRPTPGREFDLQVPVTVFTGTDDPETAPVGTVAEWAHHTGAHTTHRSFPGGHFYLDGQVRAVAREISAVVSGDREAGTRAGATSGLT
ncbi:thioesterase II family protein [Streptomyces sp. NPDC102441]|uniref:thioesterase II family protein n=1 Tax=Streptomyces sp. NPDC102441 TaxID=3366176 RepID=UPI0038196236